MLNNKYLTTFSAVNEIENAKTPAELLIILKKYYDSIYFKTDRAKQSSNYEKMNLIFVACVKRAEEMGVEIQKHNEYNKNTPHKNSR